MKRKLLLGILLGFSVSVQCGIMDWWPFSFWKDRKLSPVAKDIKKVIINCQGASLDAKFDLMNVLETQPPRVVYLWIKVLKFNYALFLEKQELARVQNSKDPRVQRGTVSYSRDTGITLGNGNIARMRQERLGLEEPLFYLKQLNLLSENNYLPNQCADKITGLILKAFPHLAKQATPTDPLPADQVEILLQLAQPLTSAQKQFLKACVTTYPVNQLYVLLELWATNANPTGIEKNSLIQKLTERVWQVSAPMKELQQQDASVQEARNLLNQCNQMVAAHDWLDCTTENAEFLARSARFDKAKAQAAAQEATFKETFQAQFSSRPEASFALSSAVLTPVIRYLQAYYPNL